MTETVEQQLRAEIDELRKKCEECEVYFPGHTWKNKKGHTFILDVHFRRRRVR